MDELLHLKTLYQKAVNTLNQKLACDDPEQAVHDFTYIRENVADRQRVYLEALEKAYAHELALKQAYSDGWRARIALGYIRPWRSMAELDRWNDAANSNPHPWNTDLYSEWRRGFIDNDQAKIYTQLIMNFRRCKPSTAQTQEQP